MATTEAFVPDITAIPTTAIDAVFERLLSDIISGAYAPGARLPAERELSRQLGASRPTLREALRRLDEWNLVEPRRGSGIVVRAYRDWSIEVIGAYLRYGKPVGDEPKIGRILIDLLAIRRGMVLEVVRLTTRRIPKGGTLAARAAMARAWAMRDQPSYAREDFEVMRAIVEAAKFTPGLWLLNRLADIWADTCDAIRFAIRPPDDYVASHSKFFDKIESGDPDGAVQVMADYIERHDRSMTKALEALA